jgi:hypothetical protein
VLAAGRDDLATMRAFALGLTSMLVMRGVNNDPHGLSTPARRSTRS